MNECIYMYIPHISHTVSRRFTILIEWDRTSACKGTSGCRYQFLFDAAVIRMRIKWSVALIRGQCLFKNCTRRIYFFYIFILRYTFYLLIFLWTDTKLMVNLELREKFTWWKKTRAELINFFIPDAALIQGHCLIEGGAYSSKYGNCFS